jgi:hypothetical protein
MGHIFLVGWDQRKCPFSKGWWIRLDLVAFVLLTFLHGSFRDLLTRFIGSLCTMHW